MNTYLFGGDEPIINNLICGLAHPLIHLGYGYELSSQTVSIEALALACCFYDPLHKYLDDPGYSQPAPAELRTSSPLELLQKIAQDKRFDSLGFTHAGSDNVDQLLAKQEDAVLEYWNAWNLAGDAKQAFRKSQEAAVALLVGTHDDSRNYDFYLVHLLTSSHAVRILLPLVPSKFEMSLVRQWWLFTIITYTCQLRPKIDLKRIEDVDVEGKNWKFVDHAALSGRYSLDAHHVKGLRAMKEAASTWSDGDKFYLKAAIKFADEFQGWGGFGMDSESEGKENAGYR